MAWLVEQQLPILSIGAMALAVMVVVFHQTRRLPALLGLVGVVLLTLGMLLVETLVVTEVERVENRIYEAAKAIENNQTEQVVAMISPDEGAMRLGAEQILRRAKFSKVSINRNLNVRVNHHTQPPTATAQFTCGFTIDSIQGYDTPYKNGLRRFEVKMIRLGETWCFVSYTMTDPIGAATGQTEDTVPSF